MQIPRRFAPRNDSVGEARRASKCAHKNAQQQVPHRHPATAAGWVPFAKTLRAGGMTVKSKGTGRPVPHGKNRKTSRRARSSALQKAKATARSLPARHGGQAAGRLRCAPFDFAQGKQDDSVRQKQNPTLRKGREGWGTQKPTAKKPHAQKTSMGHPKGQRQRTRRGPCLPATADKRQAGFAALPSTSLRASRMTT
jgi:hypothetical protein